MASSDQVDANRRKSKKRSEPKSARGKEVAQLPALRHGPRAEHSVLPCEDREEFEALVRSLHEGWRPVGVREGLVFDDIVNSRWELMRVRTVKNARLRKEYLSMEPTSATEQEIEPRYNPHYSKWKFKLDRIDFQKFLLKNFSEIDFEELDLRQEDIPALDSTLTGPANALTVLAVAYRRSSKDIAELSRLETEITRRLRESERELERLQTNRRALV